MPKTDLTTYAQQLAKSNHRFSMLPVIEKELLHYEILSALSSDGLFSNLVFQGGTCLRLCYGANRYSEDLDFVGGTDFSIADMHELKHSIEKALPRKYSVVVSVQEPQETDTLVKKWRIKVNTAPKRPDIPFQKISLEVAAVPAYTKQPRFLQLNYGGLLSSHGDTVVYAESLEEIMADKLESFVCAPHIRYRDIWDIFWLSRQPNLDINETRRLRQQKEIDYGETKKFKEGSIRISDQLNTIIESKEFLDQMKRFIPTDELDKTLVRQAYREAVALSIKGIYSEIL